MLYERWRQIALEGGRELALWEMSSGRRWTFKELWTACDGAEGKISAGGVGAVFPQGRGFEFIRVVLGGWREEAVVCPLEDGGSLFDGFSPPLPEGCRHLKATSGSTGAPRWVAFTGEQLAGDAENITRTMGLRRDWPNLGMISLAHSYGFSNLVLPLLLHGIPLLLAGAPLPEMIRKAASEFGALTVAGVPVLWRTWRDAGAISDRIRLAISAGAPLPLALEKEVYGASGVKLHNFYGATECGGIAYDRTKTPRTDPEYAGAPLENVQLAIDDQGCLEVRGRAVGETYWPDGGAGLMGGCYRSQDVAELKDGAVFLRGRATDIINVAGRKVAPDAVERVLLAHPGVAGCVVFGVEDRGSDRGELMVACVAGRRALEGEELKQFLLARLPAWQIPKVWRFVPGLEPDGRGKVSRAYWRERFRSGAIGGR